jgi:hypothetical protein
MRARAQRGGKRKVVAAIGKRIERLGAGEVVRAVVGISSIVCKLQCEMRVRGAAYE